MKSVERQASTQKKMLKRVQNKFISGMSDKDTCQNPNSTLPQLYCYPTKLKNDLVEAIKVVD